MFTQYFTKLNEIAQSVSHDNFVAIQKVRADILNDYTAGSLSKREKRTLYTASSIIMDRMRKELGLEKADGKTPADEPVDWAGREVALACAKEREMSEKKGEANYGVACYESALRAYRTLMRDSKDGFYIATAKGIFNRLIDGKCLTPIEDTPDVWEELTEGYPDGDTNKHYQCKRMSTLFKVVAPDGAVTYRDVSRTYAVDIENPEASYSNPLATQLIDKIFPITMPYFPTDKRFKVVRDTFLVDPENGDYDTVAFLYFITPTGKAVELNRYFKVVDGKLVSIEKSEFDERKVRRVDKK